MGNQENPSQIVDGPAWPGNYKQPNDPNTGAFLPGEIPPFLCFVDGSQLTIIGSGDYRWRCNACGRQYRADGTERPLSQSLAFIQVGSELTDAIRD
jgi:hypothetical protein